MERILVLLLIFMLVPIYPLKAQTISQPKIALVRLEDVSPWYAIQGNGLEVLKKVAEYLHSQNVPFHVSVVPIYTDPKRKIYLDMSDPNDPRMAEFRETIKYMAVMGGVIGIHGYTHQHGDGISTADFEFGVNEETSADTYAEAHIIKAIEAFNKSGIKYFYWETPHYTAKANQYKIFAKYFTLFYEPDFNFHRAKTIAVYYDLRADKKPVYFFPAPFLMVTNEADVLRIVNWARFSNASFVSFFFHPFREFYSTYDGEGKVAFETTKTRGYIERLVEDLKSQGYTFKTINDLKIITFKPNSNFYSINDLYLVDKNKPIFKSNTFYLPLKSLLSSLNINTENLEDTLNFISNNQKITLYLKDLSIDANGVKITKEGFKGIPPIISVGNNLYASVDFISRFLAVVQVNSAREEIVVIK